MKIDKEIYRYDNMTKPDYFLEIVFKNNVMYKLSKRISYQT